MKGFNRKKLLSSFALLPMLAVSTLAPVPSVHAAATVATATPTLQIVSPATMDLASPSGSTNGIDITFNYSCAGPATGTAGVGTLNITSATQSVAQSGSSTGDTASSGTSGGPIAVNCDGNIHQVAATLYGGGTFNVGLATVVATLTDAATTPATVSTTSTIHVLG